MNSVVETPNNLTRWTTTKQHWLVVGSEVTTKNSKTNDLRHGVSNWFFYAANDQELSKRLQEILTEANIRQSRVIQVVPLTGSTAQTYSQMDKFIGPGSDAAFAWGLGYGFGASYTSGILVVVEESEFITHEEFSSRINRYKQQVLEEQRAEEARQAADRERDQIKSLKKEMPTFESSIARLQSLVNDHQAIFDQTRSITSKKKILGGEVFMVGNTECSSKEEAIVKQEKYSPNLERAKADLAKMISRRDAAQERIKKYNER